MFSTDTLKSATHSPCVCVFLGTQHTNISHTLSLFFFGFFFCFCVCVFSVTEYTEISHTPSLYFFLGTQHTDISHTPSLCVLGTQHTDVSHAPSLCFLGTPHTDISHTPSLCVFRDKKHLYSESHSFSLLVAGRVQVNGDAMAQREDQQDARGIGDRRAPRTRSASRGTLVRSR